MTRKHPQHPFRSLARLTLWAFGFLLLTSYLAVPCLVNDRAAFVDAGSGSCQEAHVFRPNAPLPETFETALPAIPERFPLAALPAAVAVPLFILAAAISERLRRKRPWRSGTLPFVTSVPPHLPAFAALRDA